MVKKSLLIIVAVVIIAVVVAGALYYPMIVGPQMAATTMQSSATQATQPMQGNQTLVMDEAAEADSVDPATVITNQGFYIDQLVYEPLVFYNMSTGYKTIVPVLASSWNSTPDGLHYTFNLYQNAHFSNGDPINAYVVWYSFYRVFVMNLALTGTLSFDLNPAGVTAGDLNSFNVAGNVPSNQTLLSIMTNATNSVQVVNQYTIKFNLFLPYQAFLATITAPPAVVVDPLVVAANGGVVPGTPNSFMTSNAPVGSGPYVLKEWVKGDHLTLIVNPSYWVNSLDQSQWNDYTHPARLFTTVVINIKPDSLTREDDLFAGTAQLIDGVDPTRVSVINSNGCCYIPNVGLSNTIEMIGIDTQRPPTDNLNVRLAIVHGIDYDSILKNIFDGMGQPYVGPIPIGIFGHDDSQMQYTYDPQLASQYLTMAGYPNGTGLPPITLAVWSGYPYQNLIAQVIQSDLKAIGINLQIQVISVATLTNEISLPGNSTQRPNLAYWTWTFYPDGDSYVGLGGYFPYTAAFNNATITQLQTAEESQTDPNQRLATFHTLSAMVNQLAGNIWISQDSNGNTGVGIVAFRNNLQGWIYSGVFYGVAFNQLYYSQGQTQSAIEPLIGNVYVAKDACSEREVARYPTSLFNFC
ncbi:MAG TPA: ABC transporter substrate-binding protein [Candidatus Bathyarchaeia archaeon]|nr:ABC transporter substrate-binding protein [Candidatus Bathyarchaeia archaeon]